MSDHAIDADRALVERAQKELPYATVAFDALVSQYQARVYRRAYRILRTREDAEDVVQDSFLSVFRSLPRFRFEKPFEHWLNTIVINACRLVLRRRRQEQRRRGAFEDQGGRWAGNRESSNEDRLTLEKMMDVLTPETRVAVVMRFSEGWGYAEIADVLGMKESAVKMRVLRAVEQLRQHAAGGPGTAVPVLSDEEPAD